MKERTTNQINIKCPEGIIELIDEDVTLSKEYRNRSEWLLAAIRFYLDHRRKIRNCDPDFIDTPEPSVQVSINDISRRI